MTTNAAFAEQLLTWFDQHGRNNLPWQKNRTGYRVWVSEIMLQQTQVITVIPYFERFMERFPTVQDLAQAKSDEVLSLWTGLGYYSRARNLHASAIAITEQHQGNVPKDIDALIALKGIGRSTAGAILSQAYNDPGVILDGNVKRLLTRLHTIEGWPGQSLIDKQLWQIATDLTPTKRNADYTQAIMDIGATICKPKQPLCVACPMQDRCQALAQDKVASIPTPKPKKVLPHKTISVLLLKTQQGQTLLEQRPSKGIWGGLWSLPEFADLKALKTQLALDGLPTNTSPLTPIKHVFSHYKLTIEPHLLVLSNTSKKVSENNKSQWYDTQQLHTIGLATPIKKLLEKTQ
jgi:A/G-specific adenine glycosylase